MPSLALYVQGQDCCFTVMKITQKTASYAVIAAQVSGAAAAGAVLHGRPHHEGHVEEPRLRLHLRGGPEGAEMRPRVVAAGLRHVWIMQRTSGPMPQYCLSLAASPLR